MSALSTLRIQREFGYLPGIFQASHSLPLGYVVFAPLGLFGGHRAIDAPQLVAP